MPRPGAHAPASVPGRSVRPGRSPLPGRGHPFDPVRDGVGDRYHRRLPSAYGLKFLVVAWLPGGDGGQAPDVEKAAQLLVTGGVMSNVHRPVVLAEELLALSFGEVSQDYQRIGWVFRRLCGHRTQRTLAGRAQPDFATSAIPASVQH